MVPTVYDWAGGAEAFEGPDHTHHVALWLAEVFGGPDPYTREHGGYPAMMRHHLELAITEPQRRRWVQLITETADDAGLPADPEFRSAFVAYLEWGSRIGQANSQPGAEPAPRGSSSALGLGRGTADDQPTRRIAVAWFN